MPRALWLRNHVVKRIDIMNSTFRYDVFAGLAGDTFAGTGTLTIQWAGVAGTTRVIQMSCWDAGLIIMMSYDGTTFGPEFEIDQDDPPIQLPHAVRAVQIRNSVVGAISRYQISGWW